MGRRWCALACVLLSGCSFTFVNEPNEAMLTRKAPLSCTTSRSMPYTDLALGSILGAAIFVTTYEAIESFNDECSPGNCYRAWKPALLAAFLVASPWLISSAVGFSDTQQCRKAFRAQRASP